MSERPSARIEASSQAKERKRARLEERRLEAQARDTRQPEPRPSFLKNPVGFLFGQRKDDEEYVLHAVSRGTAENFPQRLAEAKYGARLTMRDEHRQYSPEYPEALRRFALGAFLEDALREGRLPSVIISEDVSGRVMAEIMRTFLNKLNRDLGHAVNVPVIAYPVGRSTPEELRTPYAKEVKRKLDASHPGASVLVVNDIIEKGNTMQPLLREITGSGYAVNVLVTRINTAQKEITDALGAPPDLKFLTAYAPVNQGRYSDMRPIDRNNAPTEEVPNALLAAELEEDRERRLQMVEEVAQAMYEAFLERPGVREYLARR